MSAADLARKIKVHRSTVMRIEQKGLLPSKKVMKEIQKVLGYDLGAICERERAARPKLDPEDKEILSPAETASSLSLKRRVKITEKDQKAIEKSLKKLREEKKKFDALYKKEKQKILDRLSKKKN